MEEEVTGIDVPGGTRAVELFRTRTEPVLAVHGISSQRRLSSASTTPRPS